MPINIVGDMVYKTFDCEEEARHIAYLYNTFPSHVLVSQEGPTISYPYVAAKTLDAAIQDNTSRSLRTLRNLGALIAGVHCDSLAVASGYEDVCLARGHYTGRSHFTVSNEYVGKIHGDLHAKNILVSDLGTITLIDRSQDIGDILFDFPLIFTLLARHVNEPEASYKTMVTEFFDAYTSRLPVGDDFFISFRNNFMNYGYFLQNRADQRSEFPEWSLGIKIADDIAAHDSFTKYMGSI